MTEPTETIESDTNGSHADILSEIERSTYRNIIKECLKFNGESTEGMVYTIKLLLIKILCDNLVCHCTKEDLK